jgi:predicted nucleotidyltransferase
VNLQKDLREFLELLNSHKVDFVVVGAHAVAFHGYPRYTGDIDFLVRSTLDNAQRVVSVLTTFGFEDAAALTESLMQPEKVIQLGRPPNRIDLLTSISGVDFDEVWSTSVAGDIDGVPVRFIGREALLKNKRASGRLKDLADVEEMDSGHSR